MLLILSSIRKALKKFLTLFFFCESLRAADNFGTIRLSISFLLTFPNFLIYPTIISLKCASSKLLFARYSAFNCVLFKGSITLNDKKKLGFQPSIKCNFLRYFCSESVIFFRFCTLSNMIMSSKERLGLPISILAKSSFSTRPVIVTFTFPLLKS